MGEKSVENRVSRGKARVSSIECRVKHSTLDTRYSEWTGEGASEEEGPAPLTQSTVIGEQ